MCYMILSLKFLSKGNLPMPNETCHLFHVLGFLIFIKTMNSRVMKLLAQGYTGIFF